MKVRKVLEVQEREAQPLLEELLLARQLLLVLGAALVAVAVDNANDSSTPAETPDTEETDEIPATTATTATSSTTSTTNTAATTATSGT